jgi:hypothetical protein
MITRKSLVPGYVSTIRVQIVAPTIGAIYTHTNAFNLTVLFAMV